MAVIVVATLAADGDVRTRRVPNRLTVPALLLALVAHGVLGGPSGLLDATVGALVAGGLLFPGWLMGWMGAGDVKLMAAVGAWLGFPAALTATLGALIAGGVIAVVVAARHRLLVRSVRGAAALAAWTLTTPAGTRPTPATSGLRFPFAAAIMAGSLISLWVRL